MNYNELTATHLYNHAASSDGCVLFKSEVKDVGAGLACITGSHTHYSFCGAE